MRMAPWRALLLGGCALIASAASLRAQQATTAPAPVPATAPAREADVASIDAIVAALYDVISGPAGQKRDWLRMRSLFHPSARLISTGVNPAGEHRIRAMDVEGYIATSGPYLDKEGFFEVEIGRRTERFGNVAHLFSTYASRHTPEGEVFMRGINSIQLWWDGKRWWVVTVMWDAERKGNSIPEEYLRRE